MDIPQIVIKQVERKENNHNNKRKKTTMYGTYNQRQQVPKRYPKISYTVKT